MSKIIEVKNNLNGILLLISQTKEIFKLHHHMLLLFLVLVHPLLRPLLKLLILHNNSLGMSSLIWVLDFGASYHMSYDPKSFVSLNNVSSIPVMTIDCTPMPLDGTGSASMSNLRCLLYS